MRLLDDLGAERSRPRRRSLKIIQIEPEQHAVAGRRRGPVDQVRMILFVSGMELQDHAAG